MLSLILAVALANAADCGITMHNLSQPVHRENNPIARPFVTHGPALTVGYFAVSTLVDYEVAHQFQKHHHSKLGKLYLVGATAFEVWAVASSIRAAR